MLACIKDASSAFSMHLCGSTGLLLNAACSKCSHGVGLFEAVAWPALNPTMPGMAD